MSARDASDLDPVETQEWLDALSAVQQHRGAERANFVVNAVVGAARRDGVYVPQSLTTRVLQHHPAGAARRKSPGDRAIEHRLRSIIRWNALAIILRANKDSSELGGHIASFQSAATLYDIGFGHFWHAPSENARRRPGVHPGPQLAGHLCARLPRRAAQRGAVARLPPGDRRQGTVVVPASVADARLLAVPHRLDGPRAADGDLPGALPEVPARPRAGRHRAAQGLGVHGRRRDGRARSRSVRSRWPAARGSTT